MSLVLCTHIVYGQFCVHTLFMDKMSCTASLLRTFSVNYKQDSVRCFSAGFVTVTCKQIIITLYGNTVYNCRDCY